MNMHGRKTKTLSFPFPEDIIQWLSFAPTDPMLAINKSVTDDIKEQLAFFSLDCAIMTVPEIIITQYFNYFYPILTDYICILTQKEAPSLLVHVKHGKFKNTMSLPQTQSLSHDMLTNLFDLKTSINIITNKKSLCPNMTLHEASKDIKSYTNLTTALQGMLDELKV